MADTDGSNQLIRGGILAVAGVFIVALVIWVVLVAVPVVGADSVTPPRSPAGAAAPDVAASEEETLDDAVQQIAVPRVTADQAWVERVAAATGIPNRALQAYATAHLVIQSEQPACGLSWNTLAGIGRIETGHGTHGGTRLGADGRPETPIRGPALDGNGNAAIRDTDGGAWDGDPVWDRAVGPMQFIPDTWVRWGVDADGDGQADPNQIDDAALAAARYLCASGPMTTTEGWRAAVFSYNHLDSYVDSIAAAANRYATDAG